MTGTKYFLFSQRRRQNSFAAAPIFSSQLQPTYVGKSPRGATPPHLTPDVWAGKSGIHPYWESLYIATAKCNSVLAAASGYNFLHIALTWHNMTSHVRQDVEPPIWAVGRFSNSSEISPT